MRSIRSRLIAPLIAVALASGAAAGAHAASVGVGADYYTGPSGQTIRDVLAYGETTWRGAALTGVLSRYSNSQTGLGTGATLVASVPFTPKTSVQALGARSLGDHGYRASRFQLGPVFAIGAGRTLGIAYTRAYDTLGPSTKGIAAEVAVPANASFIALGRGTLASVEGGGTNLQGSAGFLWSPASRLVLLGELALGRDATALSSGGGAGSGGFDVGGRASRDYVSGPALLIGVRYVIH
jgi:hypothetical protein